MIEPRIRTVAVVIIEKDVLVNFIYNYITINSYKSSYEIEPTQPKALFRDVILSLLTRHIH